MVDSIPSLSELGATHLVGVGGAGMSVIAQLLRGHGVVVSGCDRQESSVASHLRSAGIPVAVGHDAAHITDISTLVVSTAVRADNPDLMAARAAGVRVMHRSEALAALMAGNQTVAVAGTHGKTTTTAMLAAALHGGGVDASVAVGARLAARAEHSQSLGAHVGTAPIFVAEADESDGSFLRYRPQIAIITNLEPDHLDHYGTEEALRDAFDKFLGQMPDGGTVIACADDPGSAALAQRVGDRLDVITYGLSAGADVQIDVSDLRLRVPVDPRERGGEKMELHLSAPGLHNARNAAAAWIAARILGAEASGASGALARFTGAERRFQIRGEARSVTVVDDYAHHPTEVTAVIEGARSFLRSEGRPNGRVIAVFQPHLPSRTRLFAAEFARALETADAAIVLDVFLAREDPEPGISGATITENFSSSYPGTFLPDVHDLGAKVAELATAGDVVLMLGAGDIPQLTPGVLEALAGGPL